MNRRSSALLLLALCAATALSSGDVRWAARADVREMRQAAAEQDAVLIKQADLQLQQKQLAEPQSIELTEEQKARSLQLELPSPEAGLDRVGGPDGYGYEFIDSDELGGPVYSWIDPAGGTNTGLTGDDAAAAIPLPFTFRFYGVDYTGAYVCTNGWLYFGASQGTTAYSNVAIPSSGVPNQMLAVLWDDWYGYSTGQISYKTVGSTPSRQFVVSWSPWYRSGYQSNPIEFQVILNEADNSIVMQYKDVAYGGSYDNGAGATTGIESHTGLLPAQTGLQYGYNTTHLASNRAVKYIWDVKDHDVATTAVFGPPPNFGTRTVVPKATVKNTGLNTETNFAVRCTVYDATDAPVYNNEQTVTSLAAGASVDAQFAGWTPAATGAHTIAVRTALTGDQKSANDRKSYAVTVHQSYTTGGPDAAGYVWFDSDDPSGPTYNWKDISTSGTAVPFPSFDINQVNIPIGFSFKFYGTTYTDVRVGTNGVLSFDLAASLPDGNAAIPTSATPNNLIAPLWDDLHCIALGNAKYQTLGTTPNCTLVVSYNNIRYYNTGGDSLTFQVLLIEGTNEVVFQYKQPFNTDDQGWGQLATIGLENSTGTIGLQYLYDGAQPGNLLLPGRAIRFYQDKKDHDVGVSDILVPVGESLAMRGSVTPKVTVKNYGLNTETNFAVRCTVYDGTFAPVYDDEQTVATLDPDGSIDVPFVPWDPAVAGEYSIAVRTALAGDEKPANDAQVRDFELFPAFTTGGPDAGFYFWKDSDASTGAPVYNWIDITTTGTDVPFPSYDDGEGNIPIGFTFKYYDTDYTDMRVGCNGAVTFDLAAEISLSNTAMPTPDAYNSIVAAAWDDLHCIGAGTVKYQTLGTTPNCTLVVSYDNIRYYNSGGDSLSFQMLFFEGSNDILLQYKNTTTDNTSHGRGDALTVGIENADGSVGLEYLYNADPYGNMLTRGRAIRFYQDKPAHNTALSAIIAPAGGYGPDVTFFPEVRISNLGTNPESDIPVHLQMFEGAVNVYDQSVTYPGPLDAGASVNVKMPVSFNTGFSRRFLDVTAFTLLAGDDWPADDTTLGACAIGVLKWGDLADVPADRYRCAGVTDTSGHFYSIGGMDAASNAHANVYRYTFGADAWDEVAPVPGTHTCNFAATFVPELNKIYAFGGYNPSSMTYSDQVLIYDVATNVWSNGPTPCPVANSGMLNAKVADTIFVLNENTLWAYDWKTNAFNSRPAKPGVTGKYGDMLSYGGKLYQACGFYFGPGYSDEFYEYDPSTTTWTALASLPVGRHDPALVEMDGMIFCYGGGQWWVPIEPGEGLVYYFDPANPTRGWNGETDMQSAHLGGARGPGSLLIAGGLVASGGTVEFESSRLPNPSDVGVLSIEAPVGVIDTMGFVTPSATVKNFSPSVAAVADIHFYLYDGTGAERYHRAQTAVTVPPGVTLPAFFPTHQVDRSTGTWTAKCSTYLAQGDADHDNDMLSSTFRVVAKTPWGEGWSVIQKPIPGATLLKDGAWMTAAEPEDGKKYFYVAKGNKSAEFYRYSAADDSWEVRASIDPLEEGRNKPPKKGCAGVSDGQSYIYMAKGNNTFGFWRYDIAKDSWKRMPNVPEGPDGKKVKAGTDLAYHVDEDDSGWVYLLKGGRTEFYKFNAQTEHWVICTDAPYGVKPKYDYGSFLTTDAGKLYAHQAKWNDGAKHYMFRYDLDRDTWDMPRKGMPLIGADGRRKKVKDGASGAWYDGAMYALKGGNTQYFFRYTAAGDTWTELDTIPRIGLTEKKKKVKGGGDMAAYENGVFFALKGNKVNELWRYVIPYSVAGIRPERSGVMGDNFDIRAAKLEVFPNPLAGGFATVRYSLPKAGPVAVNVFDVAGRNVQRQTLMATRTGAASIDLRKLANGVYLVRFDAEGFSQSQKLIVQR